MSCLSFEGYQSRLAAREEMNERVKTIESIYIQDNMTVSSKETQHRLLFLVEGEVVLHTVGGETNALCSRDFVFLPANKEVEIHTQLDSHLIIFRVSRRMDLIQHFGLQDYLHPCRMASFYKLRCNDLLYGNLSQLKKYMDEDLDNYYYQNLKLDEMLLCCAWFYSKEELAKFFSQHSALTCEFSNYIVTNGHRYHTISELAKDMNYSVSGFDKKFKRVFGVSGYKWLKKQKAKRVLESIYSDDLSFKQIADSFDFSSESYFYEFCKAEFGKTPGQIRKNHSLDLILAYD